MLSKEIYGCKIGLKNSILVRQTLLEERQTRDDEVIQADDENLDEARILTEDLISKFNNTHKHPRHE